MTQKRLTQKFVQSASTSLAQEEFWDTLLPGFVFRVYKTGRKTYNVTYRTQLGRRGRFTIGDASLLGLSEARTKAREILVAVQKGADPSQRRRDHRSASTFAELAALYLELHCRPSLRPRSIR